MSTQLYRLTDENGEHWWVEASGFDGAQERFHDWCSSDAGVGEIVVTSIDIISDDPVIR